MAVIINDSISYPSDNLPTHLAVFMEVVRDALDEGEWSMEVDVEERLIIITHSILMVGGEVAPAGRERPGDWEWRTSCDVVDANWLVERTGIVSSKEEAIDNAKAMAPLAALTGLLYALTGSESVREAAAGYWSEAAGCEVIEGDYMEAS